MKTQLFTVGLSLMTLLSLTGCNAESFFNGTSSSSANYSDQVKEAVPINAVEEHSIKTDTPYKTIGDEDGVLFETALNEGDIAGNAEVGLYDDTHTKVSDLYDDGSHGDRVAGDGIYACRYVPDVSEETQKQYSIKIGDYETEQTSVRFFDPLTEEDFKTVDAVQSRCDEVTGQFKDAAGNIPEEKRDDALEEVRKLVDQMQLNGEVVEYRVNQHQNVVAKLSSGITYFYSVPVEGLDSGSAVNDISIATYQPFKSTYTHPDVVPCLGYPDDGANYLANEFSNVTFDVNWDDRTVSPEVVKNFGPNQVILWHGHGEFDRLLHSFIKTYYSISQVGTNQDYVEERLLAGSDGCVGFTYKYVQAYCGDMTNTFLYLGTCLSGHDGWLASTFLEKNCNAVIVNDQSILTIYNLSMIRSTAKYLAEEKTFLWFFKTGHRTLSEALAAAKKDHGSNDNYENPSKGKYKATPYIYGNSSYMIEEAVEDELESGSENQIEVTGSISLDTVYVKVGVGESVTVNISSLPSGYTASNFTWSIEDTSIATNSGGTITGVAAGSTILKVESTDHRFSQFCGITVS